MQCTRANWQLVWLATLQNWKTHNICNVSRGDVSNSTNIDTQNGARPAYHGGVSLLSPFPTSDSQSIGDAPSPMSPALLARLCGFQPTPQWTTLGLCAFRSQPDRPPCCAMPAICTIPQLTLSTTTTTTNHHGNSNEIRHLETTATLPIPRVPMTIMSLDQQVFGTSKRCALFSWNPTCSTKRRLTRGKARDTEIKIRNQQHCRSPLVLCSRRSLLQKRPSDSCLHPMFLFFQNPAVDK
ncbi:hypothetical protein QBC43DRAFT_54431 [Cladorrhinum sp. PSN259]|nr:hypothetical protein QBC43DRAFT_54431 [Cladorrhinum sp. PSN259]